MQAQTAIPHGNWHICFPLIGKHKQVVRITPDNYIQRSNRCITQQQRCCLLCACMDLRNPIHANNISHTPDPAAHNQTGRNVLDRRAPAGR